MKNIKNMKRGKDKKKFNQRTKNNDMYATTCTEKYKMSKFVKKMENI